MLESADLGRDVAAAEALLREIATDLVSLPLRGDARRLHVEALALKRVLTGWYAVRPAEGALEAMRRALDALRGAVRELRAQSASRPEAKGSG